MSVENGCLVFCSSRGDGALIRLNACVLSSIAWCHSFLLSLVFVMVFFFFIFLPGVIRSWPHSIFGISISSHVALSTCSITILVILPHYSTNFYSPGACIRFPRLY